jgi:hypothetical protein
VNSVYECKQFEPKVCKPKEAVCAKCKHYREFNDGYWLCRKFFGRESLEPKDEWISVKDELPDIGIIVRVLRQPHKNNEHLAYRVYMKHKEKYQWFLDNGVEANNITHWQSLPEKKKFTRLPFSADCDYQISKVGSDENFFSLYFNGEQFYFGEMKASNVMELIHNLNQLWMSAGDK